MLSVLNLIGIFMEIFASGLLLAGIYSFLKKSLEQKQSKDLILSLIFLGLAIYTVLSIYSQVYYNLGGSINSLKILQKISAINFVLLGILFLAFLRARFNLKIGWLVIAAAVPALFYAYQIIALPLYEITLLYQPGVVEPLVNLGRLPQLAKPLWAIGWLVLTIAFFIQAGREKGGKRILALYAGASSLLFLAAYFCANLYLVAAQGYYLIASWGINLLAILGLILAESITPESPFSRNPLGLLRSRLLFKLLSIFILLIVIIFEATTLANIAMSTQALYASLIRNYQEIIRGVDDKIEDLPKLDMGILNWLIVKKTDRNLEIYVVDKSGIVIAHPDPVRVKARTNLSSYDFIQNLLRGQAGGGTLYEEITPRGTLVKVGAYLPIKKFGGGIVVEEPEREAYQSLRALQVNTLLFALAGIALTVFCGVYFASSIERPIKKLISGTEAVSKGDLNYKIKIDTPDEIGSLAEAFNKMTRDLKESQDRLLMSEKLASLGTMAAGMAHEIKNPLVSLRTFSQILQQKWDDPEFRQKFSQIVPNEIERINKIAESLLKFGRPVKTELTKVNLNNILEDVITLFENECKKSGINVTTKFAQLPEIIGDSSQLSQAFVNIILNSIQAMEEAKGGELLVKTDIGEVIKLGRPSKVAVEKAKGEMVWEAEEESHQPIPAVFVEVTDTGPGIEPEKIKNLFDPFYTTKAKGTGMGLPITLRIIEEHKGSIKVKSQLGKGTSFIITLPQRLDLV